MAREASRVWRSRSENFWSGPDLRGGEIPHGVAGVGARARQHARLGAAFTQDDGNLTGVVQVVHPGVHDSISGTPAWVLAIDLVGGSDAYAFAGVGVDRVG